MEPERRSEVKRPVRNPKWTTLALIAGLVLLVIVIFYFATRGNPDQDKLTLNQLAQNEQQAKAPAPEKLCASKQTYDLIKRELFRRAAQLRGSDQAAFDQLSGYAVVRMENPVMESQDNSTGAINCSGSLSLDLPPGVVAAGGHRNVDVRRRLHRPGGRRRKRQCGPSAQRGPDRYTVGYAGSGRQPARDDGDDDGEAAWVCAPANYASAAAGKCCGISVGQQGGRTRYCFRREAKLRLFKGSVERGAYRLLRSWSFRAGRQHGHTISARARDRFAAAGRLAETDRQPIYRISQPLS